MKLKKWHKYVSYKVNKGKKVYGSSIIPIDDIEVPKEVLKDTGFEERSWNHNQPEVEGTENG
jgi:hypothetical protein